MEGPLTGDYALAGVRVLELTNFMAGPYCGMLLADMGADVIKVENPKGGDFTRLAGPFVDGHAAGFMAVNRNKRSLALDLKSAPGREVFLLHCVCRTALRRTGPVHGDVATAER